MVFVVTLISSICPVKKTRRLCTESDFAETNGPIVLKTYV